MAIMTTMNVTVYFNTGFNNTDIPASPAVLETAEQKTYNDPYYLREDIDTPEIRINDDYNNLVNVDYVRLYNNTTNKYSYYFASPRANARKTTILYLELDALTTMGGAVNLNYISGWESRGHIAKADDTLFANNASEDFQPLEELEATNIKEQKTSGVGVEFNPVISNINLTQLANTPEAEAEVIKGIVSGSADPVMYLPKLVSPIVETKFHIYDMASDDYKEYFIPSTAGYEANGETTKSGLAKLFSFGQLQLQASYKIPAEWNGGQGKSGGGSTLPDGVYGDLHGINETQNTNIDYVYNIDNYTIKNKKCFGMFRSIHLINMGNGAESIKKPSELYDGEDKVQIILWSDVSPNGKPYARFKHIKSSPLQYSDVVSGLTWANNQLAFAGASGSIFNSINNAFATATQARAIEQNEFNRYYTERQLVAQGLGTTVPDITGVVGSFAGGGGAGGLIQKGASQLGKWFYSANEALQGNMPTPQTLSQLEAPGTEYAGYMGAIRAGEDRERNRYEMEQARIQQTINENNIGILRNNNVVAPTVLFTPDPNLGLYGYNYFVSYEVRLSKNDIINLDKYFQRFGYNGLHRPLTQQCFKERQYYNYVQAFDINIKSEYGRRIRMKAIGQLNAGVRTWNVLPDASYYDIN